ncbi:MAG: hypothetical protein ACKOZW_10460, partial [Cyanobium sp.]
MEAHQEQATPLSLKFAEPRSLRAAAESEACWAMSSHEVCPSERTTADCADQEKRYPLRQWLAGLGDRYRHFAAIVFETTPAHWPAALYIDLDAETGHAWLQHMDPREVEVAESHLESVREAHALSYMACLRLTVHSPSGLGMVMHALHSNGY